jgi:hypothetical protein
MVGFTLGGTPPWGNRVDAGAIVYDRQGTGSLNISVGVSTTAEAQSAVTICHQNPSCVVSGAPSVVTVIANETLPRTPKDPHVIVVDVYQGRTHVNVELANTDMQSVDGGPPVPTRAEPVLTVGQAIDLALSPGLYLFP